MPGVSVTPFPISGYMSETTTSHGMTSTKLVPAMPRGSVPVEGTPYWLLPSGEMVEPILNNRAYVRQMMNGQ